MMEEGSFPKMNSLSEREQKIYNMICENLHLSVEQVMAELDISRSTVFRDYAIIPFDMKDVRVSDQNGIRVISDYEELKEWWNNEE